jgi:hypothetical protein
MLKTVKRQMSNWNYKSIEQNAFVSRPKLDLSLEIVEIICFADIYKLKKYSIEYLKSLSV